MVHRLPGSTACPVLKIAKAVSRWETVEWKVPSYFSILYIYDENRVISKYAEMTDVEDVRSESLFSNVFLRGG